MFGKVFERFVIEFRSNTTGAVAGIRQVAGAIAAFAKQIRGPLVLAIGGMAALGIAAIRAGRRSVAMAAMLDAGLREIATLLPETKEQLEGIREAIIDMSRSVPQLPPQLTEGVYQAISAGARDTSEALNLVSVAARTAVAGLTDTGTAVDVLTTVMNAFQLPATKVQEVADILFKTVERGKVRFEDLASSIGNVATSAGLAGVSIAETSAAIATLTKFGLSAEAASNALNRLILVAVNATEAQKEAAAELGIEFSAAALRTKGLIGFVQDLNRATGGSVETLGNLIGSIRAARAGFVLAGDGLAEYVTILDATDNSVGAMTAAFNENVGSLENQRQLLQNKINALWSEFGEAIIPRVASALEGLNTILSTSSERQIQLAEQVGDIELATALRRKRAAEIATKALEEQLDIARKLRAEREQDLVGVLRVGSRGFVREAIEEAAGPGKDINELLEGRTELLKEQHEVQTRINALFAEMRDLEERGKTASRLRFGLLATEHDQRVIDLDIEQQRLKVLNEELGQLDALKRERDRQTLAAEGLTEETNATLVALKAEIAIRKLGGEAQRDIVKALEEAEDKERAIMVLRRIQLILFDRLREAADVYNFRIDTQEDAQTLLNKAIEDRLAATEDEKDALDDQIDLLKFIVTLYVAMGGAIEVVTEGIDKAKKASEEWVSFIADAIRLLEETSGQQLKDTIDLEKRITAFVEAAKDIEVAGKSAAEYRKEVEALARQFVKSKEEYDAFIDALEEDIDLASIREARDLVAEVEEKVRKAAEVDISFRGLSDEAAALAQEIIDVQEQVTLLTVGIRDQLSRGLTLDPKVKSDLDDLNIRLNSLRAEFQLREEESPAFIVGEDAIAALDKVKALEEGVEDLTDTLTAEELRKSVGFTALLETLGQTDELLLEAADAGLSAQLALIKVNEQLRQTKEGDAARATLLRYRDALNDALDKARLLTETTEDQRAALEELLPQVENLDELLRLLPSVDVNDLISIGTAGLEVLEQFQDRVLAAQERITKAKEAIAAREALGLKATSEQTDELSAAEEALIAILAELIEALREAGVSMRDILEITNDLEDETDDLETSWDRLVKAMLRVSRVARGLLSVADAAGALKDELRLVLRGVINIAEAFAAFPTDPIGAVSQGIGGLVSLVSGFVSLFGGDNEAQQRAEDTKLALVDLNNTMEKLRTDIQALSDVLTQTTGETLSRFQAISEILDDVLTVPRGVGEAEFGAEPFNISVVHLLDTFEALQKFGVTSAELADIAARLGIPVENLIELFKLWEAGLFELEDFVKVRIIATQELFGLQDRLAELELAEAVRTLAFQFSALNAEFEVFDITDPIDQLRRFHETTLEFGGLTGELAARFAALNFDTAAGRADARAFIQEQIRAAQAGSLTAQQLGQFTLESWLDFLLQTNDLLDQAMKEAEGAGGETTAFQVRRTITETTGNRIVGTLTTISIINQLILATVREILLEMGGTLPTDVSAVSFRPIATELDILDIERQQLEVLQQIRDFWIFGTVPGIMPPTAAEVAAVTQPQNIPFVPSTETAPPVEFSGDVTINTSGGVSAEDAKLVATQIAPEINRELERTRRRQARFTGFREPV
jgi:TP901 family phage tail tape measure protein